MFLNIFMKNNPNLSEKIIKQYKFYKINSITYNILVIYSYKINNINYILYFNIIATIFFGFFHVKSIRSVYNSTDLRCK